MSLNKFIDNIIMKNRSEELGIPEDQVLGQEDCIRSLMYEGYTEGEVINLLKEGSIYGEG